MDWQCRVRRPLHDGFRTTGNRWRELWRACICGAHPGCSGAALDGGRIEDRGHKMGLNGVDNGRLYFDHVRIPRDHLLDRYASVSPEGDYDSSIASDDKRFFTMLGTLVGGRISVAAASVTAARKALAIAIRYGALRRPFGGGDGVEARI